MKQKKRKCCANCVYCCKKFNGSYSDKTLRYLDFGGIQKDLTERERENIWNGDFKFINDLKSGCFVCRKKSEGEKNLKLPSEKIVEQNKCDIFVNSHEVSEEKEKNSYKTKEEIIKLKEEKSERKKRNGFFCWKKVVNPRIFWEIVAKVMRILIHKFCPFL